MFDIGFWELVTIGVIGIVVVGPDKLPEVVRSGVKTVRKVRRMFDDVKQDIERELDIDEMRRMVHEADMEEHIRKLNQSVMDATKKIEKNGKSLLDDIDREITEQDTQRITKADIVNDRMAAQPLHDTPIFDEHFPNPESERETGIEGEVQEDEYASSIIASKSAHEQRQPPL